MRYTGTAFINKKAIHLSGLLRRKLLAMTRLLIKYIVITQLLNRYTFNSNSLIV